MKLKKRVFVIIFQLLVIGLLSAIIVIVNARKDKVEPVISIEQEALILTAEEIQGILDGNLDVLMEGVTAADNLDGDITKDIFIFSITPKRDNLYAVVNYRVLDSADNVGYANRIAYLRTPEELHQVVMDRYKEPEKTEDSSEEDVEETKKKSGAPVIRIKSEATIALGETFDPSPYILEFSDDKDSVQMLVEHVTVIGSYDPYTPGVYEMAYYLTDSDGNQSDIASIKITVQ